MKIRFKKDHVLVISSWLVHLSGIPSGIPEHARAAAFFPFIFVRSEDVVEPWLINHELIHFKQQLETLFIGLLTLKIIESLYAAVILKKSRPERYIWHASEQEAYRNQNDPDYLNHRKTWSLFCYIRDKRQFTFGKPGEIIFTDTTQ